MKIWAISDTHFSNDGSKTMDRFGKIWVNHAQKIIHNWQNTVSANDLVFVTGDISWEYQMNGALQDIKKFSGLPGTKVIIKGNHDTWWKNLEKVRECLPASILPLQGTAVKFRELVICGTRAWVSPNDQDFDPLDRNPFEKEMKLLKNALEEAVALKPGRGIHLLLHFPPFTSTGRETPFYDMLIQYPVATCTYGHFHLKKEWDALPKGNYKGIYFQLASTDYLNHVPVCLWDGDSAYNPA